MTFLTALGISVLYMLIGTLVGALWTEPEKKISIIDVVTWPVIISICIVVAIMASIANLIKRINNMKG